MFRNSSRVITEALKKGAGTGLVSGGLGGAMATFAYTGGTLIMGDQSAFKRDALKAEGAALLAGALVGLGTGALAAKGLTFAGSLFKKTFSQSTHTLFSSMTAVPPGLIGGALADGIALEHYEQRSQDKIRESMRAGMK